MVPDTPSPCRQWPATGAGSAPNARNAQRTPVSGRRVLRGSWALGRPGMTHRRLWKSPNTGKGRRSQMTWTAVASWTWLPSVVVTEAVTPWGGFGAAAAGSGGRRRKGQPCRRSVVQPVQASHIARRRSPNSRRLSGSLRFRYMPASSRRAPQWRQFPQVGRSEGGSVIGTI